MRPASKLEIPKHLIATHTQAKVGKLRLVKVVHGERGRLGFSRFKLDRSCLPWLATFSSKAAHTL